MNDVMNVFGCALPALQNEYSQNAMELVRVVQHCLFREAELVDRQEHLNVCQPLPP